MNYRKFQADKIFNGYEFLDPGHVLIMEENGTVVEIIAEMDAGEGIERLKGILSPGFINAHCHLELSHLKDVIPPHTGLVPFLIDVVGKRDFQQELILDCIEKAEKEMEEAGIVAVGDIGNTNNTLQTKKKSRIAWNNFVEVLSFTDERSSANMQHYSNVLESFIEAEKEIDKDHFKSSLVPHAPYSISNKTFMAVNECTANSVISIHNQETPMEDELYEKGTGGFIPFFKIFGFDASPFPVTGKSSLRSCLPHFNKNQRLILVHNTFTPEQDVEFAMTYAKEHLAGIHFCVCANANLYIENRMPPINMLIRHGAAIVLGTDSYSSNWQLSIAAEIKTIREKMPEIPLQLMLQWATINGAKALDRSDVLGSFEAGKRPGMVLLDALLNARKIC
jgi:cytosine/adenosine deaminase-related metal-dependent hydrolase